ncbi:hypothetical protein ASG60_13325 [Methylobacterium sp. Leaf469]|jgi:hypothetical protein|uniref:hypothetical protein n=1 Tax=unclassified Methylobacterium TaxID=2615210 RepID=UPI0006FCF2DD|nr:MULTISPECIES: hypothetical protein [unclassified Methylobacterium]USU31191.1 hypothetical protein NG677_17850 [Methylobacterium sp. OTU13CASTA1]KQO56733.1 hypothetical protein ASF22_09385 [Methylobacterium sp. Leaf87]KQP19003.1 hypothetical protein ASF25_11435 [Methylobacterium sp. Leaf100]KQP32904.1 hypothetical protein ASF27_16800 [Methylobacterium sp. Leaf102]KQP70808.1 hypothetical protein ASF52_15555 [Methylobacterium sp. Leaf112]
MTQGDQVVFARLDVAEALGIWRHATGRVIGIHPAPGEALAVDVEFAGHGVLVGYSASLFTRIA